MNENQSFFSQETTTVCGAVRGAGTISGLFVIVVVKTHKLCCFFHRGKREDGSPSHVRLAWQPHPGYEDARPQKPEIF